MVHTSSVLATSEAINFTNSLIPDQRGLGRPWQVGQEKEAQKGDRQSDDAVLYHTSQLSQHSRSQQNVTHASMTNSLVNSIDGQPFSDELPSR
jgi:hypothetical protein